MDPIILGWIADSLRRAAEAVEAGDLGAVSWAYHRHGGGLVERPFIGAHEASHDPLVRSWGCYVPLEAGSWVCASPWGEDPPGGL